MRQQICIRRKRRLSAQLKGRTHLRTLPCASCVYFFLVPIPIFAGRAYSGSTIQAFRVEALRMYGEMLRLSTVRSYVADFDTAVASNYEHIFLRRRRI